MIIHHEKTVWTLVKLIRITLSTISHNVIVTAWTDESEVNILGWEYWGLVFSLSLEKENETF